MAESGGLRVSGAGRQTSQYLVFPRLAPRLLGWTFFNDASSVWGDQARLVWITRSMENRRGASAGIQIEASQ